MLSEPKTDDLSAVTYIISLIWDCENWLDEVSSKWLRMFLSYQKYMQWWCHNSDVTICNIEIHVDKCLHNVKINRSSYCKMRNVGGLYLAVFKISQFGEDLIWRYYWKKLGVVHIFFIWWLLILAKFNNSPISPNKSSPIIYGFTVYEMVETF